MGSENTNVVIKENKVLLARHTYGSGKGMLIIPGGYVNIGETLQEAFVCECSEILWIDVNEASSRDDVPELTKLLIKSAISKNSGLIYKDYQGSTKHAPYSLYCV